MPKWSFDNETDEFKGDPLYFIQEGSAGPIKIGRGEPMSRLRTMQIGNSRKLWLIGSIEHNGYREAMWHAAFAPLRLRGEWFRPDQRLLNAIRWALKNERWADDAPPPCDTDPDRFADVMLDAVDWYDDLVFDGVPEARAAQRAMAYAVQEASTAEAVWLA